MDPRSTWYMPEQLGPATELWTQIFNSATRSLRDLQMGDSGKSSDGDGSSGPGLLHDNEARTRSFSSSQDFIPLHGDSGADLATKRSAANGFGDRTNVFSNNLFNNKRRKDNLASTYDWNSSGKVGDGGTPWWSRRSVGNQFVSPYPDLTNHNVGLCLSREIGDFYAYMYPRPEEHLMRSEVVNRIDGIVKSIWPDARVEIYGSYRTMLYLPTSDIDLVVFGDLGDCPYFRIGNELEKSHIAEMGSIKVLDKASVPIVKLTDDITKVKVDISFNMRSGIACANLIEEFIRQYPLLPQLVFVLKQFLLQRDLNEVWTGGISSYSLILMAVSFLQMHVQPEPTNLGVQLVEFFELYGVNFNYLKTGISVSDGGGYFSKDEARSKMTQGYGTAVLCIDDPLNPGSDICKSSYGFMEVRKAFGFAYGVLKQALLVQLDQDECTTSVLGRIVRITDDVIEYRDWIHRNWAHKVPPPMLYPNTLMPPPHNMVYTPTPLTNTTLNITLNNTVDRQGEAAIEDTSNANMDVALIVNSGGEPESAMSSPDVLSSASDTDSDLSSQASGSSKESRENSPDLPKTGESALILPSAELTVKDPKQGNVGEAKKIEHPKPVKEQQNRTVNTPPVSQEVVSESKPKLDEAATLQSKTPAVSVPKEKPLAKDSAAKPPQQQTSSQPQMHRTLPNMVQSKIYRNSNHQSNFLQGGSRFRSSSVGGNGIHQANGAGSSNGNNRGSSNNNNNVNGKKVRSKIRRDNNLNSMR